MSKNVKIQNLIKSLTVLKRSTMFDAKAKADIAMEELTNVVMDMDERLQKLEEEKCLKKGQ